VTSQNHAIGNPFIELQSVDSTNNYAMRQVHAGVARQGFVVLAHEQTAGRGQRQNQWEAQQGKNLMMSVVLEPPPQYPVPQFSFSMAVALGVHGLLKKFAGNSVKIKWPNDLYFDDRKAGGILIENVLSGGTWKAAVVGIGLNINQTDFGALHSKAVSLKQLTGSTYNPVALAKDLCRELEAVLHTWETTPNAVREQYLEQLYKREQWVKLKKGPRIFEAFIKGVNDSGQLVTQHALEETFDVGEVQWVI
jgi:BirA family biotin operon repressor/biotin-[acetyl-CoA-carboxylase] ligase